jgi:NAD(P)H-flavin reductase
MAAKARDCRARVVATRRLAPAIVEVDLRMADPPRLDFDAGQWISVSFGPKTVRAYSIASTPREAEVITLCADVAPSGPGSRWFEALASGDDIAFKGPLGGFVFDRADPRPALLVAEEIGIVPIRSILIDLDETGVERPATLVHWAPTADGLAYRPELADLARRRPGFVYHPCVSDTSRGWNGACGTLLEAVERVAPPDAGVGAYVAGGEATIKQVRALLMARGLDRKSVKWERFW